MRTKYYLAVFILPLFFIFAPFLVKAESSSDDIKPLALCLRNKDFKMYGATNCSACAIEKGYFGENFNLIKYINCDENRDLCQSKNIHAYPTWEDRNGKQYKGAMKLEVLAEVSGCQVLKPIAVNEQNFDSENLKKILAAFIAGLLSFLAPCLLPLLPSYFSVITGFTFVDLYGLNFEKIRGRVFISTLFFTVGFAAVYTILGATGSIVGALLDKYLPILLRASGIFLIILGLIQAGFLKPFSLEFDFAWRVQKRLTHLGFITAGVTGVAAALCWIPCISPLLTPILILSAKSETVFYGAFLLFVYSLGLTLPFLAGGLFFPTVVKTLQEHRGFFHQLSRIAGIFLIVFGAILILDKYRLLVEEFNKLLVGKIF
jgi:cytochrome c-type biogenesis protein